MEHGSLAEWSAGDAGVDGGGVFNSGIAEAHASRERAHHGHWSARLAITTRRESGTRLFRWQELRAVRDLLFDVWLFIPRRYTLTADPDTGRFWNLVQFKSSNQRGANDSIWFLGVRNRSPDGALIPELGWWSATLQGPRRGQSGSRAFRRRDAVLPIGRWFRVSARLRQSSGFDGVVQMWVDGRRLFDMRHVRTGYRDCSFNPWCVDQGWSVNLYSDGLVPKPVLYVDDASIRRRR